MADMVGDGKPGGKKRTMLVAVLAIVLVAVLVMALALSSSGNAPGGNEGDKDTKDTSDDVDETKLVSGVASDFILNESDMGADWTASILDINLDYEPMNASITSAAGVRF
jgi:ABC-type glycerol-3-phosphate transport system substrate-binding protein